MRFQITKLRVEWFYFTGGLTTACTRPESARVSSARVGCLSQFLPAGDAERYALALTPRSNDNEKYAHTPKQSVSSS